MLVLANEIFDSPPVFAWVLPVFVRLKPGRRKLFSPRHGHVYFVSIHRAARRRGKRRRRRRRISEEKEEEAQPRCRVLWFLILSLHRTARRRRGKRRRRRSHRKEAGDRRRSVS